MKQILYDMGLLILVRWLLQRVLSLSHPSDQDLSWKGSPHPKIEKNRCVLKWLLCKIQCFKPIFFCLSGKSVVTDPPPPREKIVLKGLLCKIQCFKPMFGTTWLKSCLVFSYAKMQSHCGKFPTYNFYQIYRFYSPPLPKNTWAIPA